MQVCNYKHGTKNHLTFGKLSLAWIRLEMILLRKTICYHLRRMCVLRLNHPMDRDNRVTLAERALQTINCELTCKCKFIKIGFLNSPINIMFVFKSPMQMQLQTHLQMQNAVESYIIYVPFNWMLILLSRLQSAP